MPHRIILIRHAESVGGLDTKVYERVPDNQVSLTDTGKKQAFECGVSLRKIVGPHASLKFLVSPYRRSMQTLSGILHGGQFEPETYTFREDARLREQDFGNFQVSSAVTMYKAERNKFGSFYYRFPHGESGSDVFVRVTSFWSSMFREMNRQHQLDGTPNTHSLFDEGVTPFAPHNIHSSHLSKPSSSSSQHSCSSSPCAPYAAENFVIVSHGITIRLLLMRYFQWSVGEFHRLHNPNNCQVIVMELDRQTGKYQLTTPIKCDCTADTFCEVARDTLASSNTHQPCRLCTHS